VGYTYEDTGSFFPALAGADILMIMITAMGARSGTLAAPLQAER